MSEAATGETAKQPGTIQRGSIAVDLGAESCRVSLLRWDGSQAQGRPSLQLVHRFANGPVRAADGSLRWPLETILHEVDAGVRRCAELAPEGIRSLGVDGWAVDYVRLDREGQVLEAPHCYRDERHAAAASTLYGHISSERLREIAGIEQQPLNTLYQLYADHLSGRPATRWLNLPEYLLFRWGAEPVAEYTNASHTELVDLYAANWSREIFRAAGLDLSCAPRLVPPGTLLGKLSGPLASVAGLEDVELIAPACHDTASAVAGIPAGTSADSPAAGENWAYVSCGTWSLIGTLLHEPLNSPSTRADNFTNLGAVGGATCFHKGVNGMWMLKQCTDFWAQAGTPWDLLPLLEAADREPPPPHLLHVDDPSLLGMGEMPNRINGQRAGQGLAPIPTNHEHAPDFISLILHSLAARYAEVLGRIERHSGKQFRRVVMVGGGSQNLTLRRLTAERTGCEVLAGPAESSTIGNLAVQLAVLDHRSPATSLEFAAEVSEWARRIAPDV